MAVAATITISGSTSGDALANQIFNALVSLPASVNQKQAVSVPTTPGVTVPLPTGTQTVVILPTNPNAATALTLKGVTGDTGLIISMTLPTILAIPVGTTSLWLMATAFAVPVELVLL